MFSNWMVCKALLIALNFDHPAATRNPATFSFFHLRNLPQSYAFIVLILNLPGKNSDHFTSIRSLFLSGLLSALFVLWRKALMFRIRFPFFSAEAIFRRVGD
jgi:hypothetical protein